eukprot:scaffold55367_cov32-Tisochrysis_lutea.AAC.3
MIGPMVEPQGQSLRTTNSCGGGRPLRRASSRTTKAVTGFVAYLRRGLGAQTPMELTKRANAEDIFGPRAYSRPLIAREHRPKGLGTGSRVQGRGCAVRPKDCHAAAPLDPPIRVTSIKHYGRVITTRESDRAGITTREGAVLDIQYIG